MKTSTRILTLLVALCLALCLFAGCSSSNETAAPAETAPAQTTAAESPAQEAAPVAQEPAQAQEAAPAEPAPEAAEEPAPEAAPAEEGPAPEAPAGPPPEGPAPEGPGNAVDFSVQTENAGSGRSSGALADIVAPDWELVYPLGDPGVVTMWYAFDQNAFGQYASSITEFPCMDYATQQTGVRLEAVEVSNTAATEQYNLMIAAGDYCDMIPTSNYSGGAAQAYADDVIIDLTPYLEDNAPNFWAQLQSYTPAEQYNGTTDGLWLSLPAFTISVISDQGYYTRGDWLDELGLDVPTNQGEFMDMIYAMYDAYQPDYALPIGPGCSFDWGNSWFDVALYTVSGTSVPMYMADYDAGVIGCGLTTDNYRSYLEWLRQCYVDGLVNQEFYVSEMGRNESMNIIGSGNAAYFTGMADHIAEFYDYASVDTFDVRCLPFQLNDEGFVYKSPTAKVGSSGGGGGGGRGGNSVTIYCDDPAYVVQWLNYFYTEDGYMFANYGIPGVAWNYDEDGNVEYTDVILHNPQGLNSQMAFNFYGWSFTSSFGIGTRYLDTYDETTRAAIEMWSDTANVRYTQEIPTAAGLDADESNSVVNQIADICAYADEVILKWVVGENELNDASWAEYCDRLESLGLGEVTAVYQKAYDDFIAEFGA